MEAPPYSNKAGKYLGPPLSLVVISFAIAAVVHGWGKPVAFFSPQDLKETLRLQFAIQTVWIITYCQVRLSVACSLLRYGLETSWRWTLHFIIGLQLLISSSYIVIQFAQCTPIRSNWQNIPGARCWNIKPIVNCGWAAAAIYIATDLALSLMPIRLIRTLHRSTSEKILTCVLMDLGILATAVACAKMTTFTTFGKGDPTQDTIIPSMWAKVEEQVGIVASSAPCLKSPMEKLLKKLGILKEHLLARQSFVADLSMPGMLYEQPQRGSDAESDPKKEIRIDSLAVRSGTLAASNGTLEH